MTCRVLLVSRTWDPVRSETHHHAGERSPPDPGDSLRVGHERGAEVTDHAELGEDGRPFAVAVEAIDLAVDQYEDVAARRVHPLAGRRQRPGGEPQRAEVGSLQRQL